MPPQKQNHRRTGLRERAGPWSLYYLLMNLAPMRKRKNSKKKALHFFCSSHCSQGLIRRSVLRLLHHRHEKGYRIPALHNSSFSLINHQTTPVRKQHLQPQNMNHVAASENASMAQASKLAASPISGTPSSYPVEVAPAVALVMSLNDKGAALLQANRADESIEQFAGALRLWESVAERLGSYDVGAGSCSFSTLETCISKSLAAPHFYATTTEEEDTMTKSIFSQAPGDRFIYRRSIRLTPEASTAAGPSSIPSGITLSLIIILNLAMAHHVSGIQNNNNRQKLQKAIQLYELAHRLQMEERISSPRATMIISNNVGEIHLAVGNVNKHHMCAQHLLSTTMFMVDCQGNISRAEMEGFFRNTSHLILRNTCAPAA